MKNAVHRRNAQSNETRLRALKTAVLKLETTPREHWLIDEELANQVIANRDLFDQLLDDRDRYFLHRVEANRERVGLRKKARLVQNHFLQSMHNAVERGVLEARNRVYFKIRSAETHTTVPQDDEAVITWGQNLVKGESERRADRLPELIFPPIDEVEDALEVFRVSRTKAIRIGGTYKRKQQEVVAMVTKLNDFLPYLWDRLESELRELPAPTKRELAREWGVQYVVVLADGSEEEVPTEGADYQGGNDEEGTV